MGGGLNEWILEVIPKGIRKESSNEAWEKSLKQTQEVKILDGIPKQILEQYLKESQKQSLWIGGGMS